MTFLYDVLFGRKAKDNSEPSKTSIGSRLLISINLSLILFELKINLANFALDFGNL